MWIGRTVTKILSNTKDSNNWGIGKSILMGAAAKGYDMQNPDAIKAALTYENLDTLLTESAVNERQVLAYLPDVFSDKNKQESTGYETQLAELYEQIGRLKVENDFLKKKCDVFRG